MRAMVRPIAALSALLLLALAGRAHGQERYFQEGRTDTISFNVDRERNTQQRILIASLFGGAVVFGGVGLLFHIDSKNKADEVSTDSGRHTGRIYTEELDDTRSAAIRSRNFAIASYALVTGAEAVRVGRKLGISAIPTVWKMFPVLHVSHAAGFWSGLAQYLRKPDWRDEPERIPAEKPILRAV